MACYLCHIDRTIDTQRAHATTIARSTRTTSRLVNTITNLQHTHDVTAMNTYTPYKAILTCSTRTTSRLVNTITNLLAHARRHGYEYLHGPYNGNSYVTAMKFKFTLRFHTQKKNPRNRNDVVKKKELSYMLICSITMGIFVELIMPFP